MNVELINATPDPEILVAQAARNDYRTDGVIGHGFTEIMDGAEGKREHIEDVADEHNYSALTGEKIPDHARSIEDDGDRYWIPHPHLMAEARQRTLLDHLIDHGHWGPFEHPQATVAIEGVSRVLMAQITRHRHFTFDIMSLRYVDVDDTEAFQLPQFRGNEFDVDREGVHEFDTEAATDRILIAYEDALEHYRDLLDMGVPSEQARKVLPMGVKVNIVMSGNARAWMHILGVRTKADVQGETRRCAEAIFEELSDWMPHTFEKYDEDVLPMKLNP